METLAALGLDVSKLKVDCALWIDGKVRASRSISNNPAGFEMLASWLVKQKVDRVHACCEATGPYSEAIATWLADAGHVVSVVNPARISAYGKSRLVRAKTDAVDARLIAQFCASERPEPWQPNPLHERQLLALVRYLQQLQDMRVAEHHRLPTMDSAVTAHIQQHLAFLDAEIETLKAKIAKHIDDHDDLRGRRDLLDSIPGLGDATIAWLLAYFGDGTRFDGSKQATAFAGLTPKPHESGTSVHGKAHIAKTGHADLRRALYMPGVVAFSRCAVYRPFVTRLLAKNKPKKLVIVALMRKLLAIAHAVLRSGKPFDPSLHSA